MAANNLPDFAILEICAALVKHAPFASAAEAGRALLACGLVSKTWNEATSHDDLWRALCFRCSPAVVRATADGPLPAPVTRRTDHGYDCETSESVRLRSRYFGDAITSMFRVPVTPAVASFRDQFRRRVLAARHAARAYRAAGTTTAETGGGIYRVERPKFTCTTEGPVGPEAPSLATPLADMSFVFEVFELDGRRRRRECWHDDFREDDPDEEPRRDFVTDKMLHAFAGPPHFASRDDLGTTTENLLWTHTVRACEHDGTVLALVPLDDTGRLLRTHTVFVDSGMDDYHSEWCIPWRVVVTAVRDCDGKMCQIADVRGLKITGGKNEPTHGFWEAGGDTCTGNVEFCVGDFDDEESLECNLHFLPNSTFGPRVQGQPGRGLGEVAPSDDERDSVTEEEASDPAAAIAKEAFSSFMDTAFQSGGAVFEVSLTWLALYDHGDIGEFLEPIHEGSPAEIATNVQTVARKLARLTWA